MTGDGTYTDPGIESVHSNGPNGAFWDGHVENVEVPPISDPERLRKNLTRDGTDTRHSDY